MGGIDVAGECCSYGQVHGRDESLPYQRHERESVGWPDLWPPLRHSPQMGHTGKRAPHQSAVGAADSFPHGGSHINNQPALLFEARAVPYL